MTTQAPYRWLLLAISVALVVAGGRASARAHDVPDRFFDRAIQVTLHADRVTISYQLSLTQLTLGEELLALVGVGGLSGAGPSERLSRYSSEMAPLLARGLLVRVDGVELPVCFVAASHRVEDHPRFAFEMETHLPPSAAAEHRLAIEDTSFFLEKGRVRLAVRSDPYSELVRCTVPRDIESVEVKASWEMSPEQQDAARRAEATWRWGAAAERRAPNAENDSAPASSSTDLPSEDHAATSSKRSLLSLFDQSSDGLAAALLGLAFFFGAAHAITPGHGKTMVAAYLVGERGTLRHAVGLGLTTSLTHTSSVLVVALALTLIGPELERQIHTGFSLTSGLLVAAIGGWLLFARLRTGRAGHASPAAETGRGDGPAHAVDPLALRDDGPRWSGIVTLGVSGGIVPCWDAVALLLFAAAAGQLTQGFWLLVSFSAGLASVLVAVGILAVKLRGFLSSNFGSGRLVRSLPVVSATAILAVGVYLCVLTLQAPRAALGLSAATRPAGP